MKVAYNGCDGGFCLSREAVILARKLSGNDGWGGVTIKGDVYEDGRICDSDYGSIHGISRDNEFLISVIETLKDKASGFCAELRIDEIPDGAEYDIDEYDGYESVLPPRQSW